jgi:hypothetical protein
MLNPQLGFWEPPSLPRTRRKEKHGPGLTERFHISEPESNMLRMIFLQQKAKQLPWNDTLAKKRGGGMPLEFYLRFFPGAAGLAASTAECALREKGVGVVLWRLENRL